MGGVAAGPWVAERAHLRELHVHRRRGRRRRLRLLPFRRLLLVTLSRLLLLRLLRLLLLTLCRLLLLPALLRLLLLLLGRLLLLLFYDDRDILDGLAGLAPQLPTQLLRVVEPAGDRHRVVLGVVVDVADLLLV